MSLEAQKLASAIGAAIGRLLKRLVALETRPGPSSAGAGQGLTMQKHSITSNSSSLPATVEIDIIPALQGRTCLILAEQASGWKAGAISVSTAVLSERLEYRTSGSEQTIVHIIGPLTAVVETSSTVKPRRTVPRG